MVEGTPDRDLRPHEVGGIRLSLLFGGSSEWLGGVLWNTWFLSERLSEKPGESSPSKCPVHSNGTRKAPPAAKDMAKSTVSNVATPTALAKIHQPALATCRRRSSHRAIPNEAPTRTCPWIRQ